MLCIRRRAQTRDTPGSFCGFVPSTCQVCFLLLLHLVFFLHFPLRMQTYMQTAENLHGLMIFTEEKQHDSFSSQGEHKNSFYLGLLRQKLISSYEGFFPSCMNAECSHTKLSISCFDLTGWTPKYDFYYCCFRSL